MKSQQELIQAVEQLDKLLEQAVSASRKASSTSTWADLAQVQRPIKWDWPGWLPRGFLTVVASEAGVGKSSLCLHVAASYIDGRAWPDGTPFTARPGKILWAESEGGRGKGEGRGARGEGGRGKGEGRGARGEGGRGKGEGRGARGEGRGASS